MCFFLFTLFSKAYFLFLFCTSVDTIAAVHCFPVKLYFFFSSFLCRVTHSTSFFCFILCLHVCVSVYVHVHSSKRIVTCTRSSLFVVVVSSRFQIYTTAFFFFLLNSLQKKK